ncbi:MAG: MMPL family transporter, partial [Chloroflexi bacterium]|nr:MMPL family transporter [Chloroflexota bacterium]
MKMSFTESLARKSARHPGVTIVFWLVALAVSLLLISTLLSSALVTDMDVTNNPESKQADTLIKERLAVPKSTTQDEMVIVRSSSFTVDDPQFQEAVTQLSADLLALGDGVVKGSVNYYMTRDQSLVSQDRHSTLIPLIMPKEGSKVVDKVYEVGDRLAKQGTFEVYYTGAASFDADTTKLAEDTLRKGETIGVLVALVVLAIVFGAMVAALLPILLGVIAIIAALGLVSLVGVAMDFSFFITNMVTMMGLAVGIDYSLFIVNRYREERRNGLDKIEAIGVTGGTANKAIFFSGLTVVLALLSLVVFPLSIFKSMGIGAILVVITAIMASMTILPAVMSLLGDKVNAMRIPLIQRKTERESGSVSGFWATVVRVVTRRPAVSLVVTAGVLILALTPFFDRVTGMSGISGIPDSLRAKQGFLVLQNEFHIG